VSQQHHELPVLGAIAGVIRWIEELISLLSGPLLTVGLGIALIDLLTGGGLLRSMPELLFAWAVSMAVGIDSQLVATWDRVRMSARRAHWWAVAGYVILGCALGYVGFLSAEAFGLSESDALARLGIDAESWQLQRAVLAVFLVALSGFTRYHAPPRAKQTLEDERAALARELELEPLRQRLRAQRTVGVAALARQALSAATGHEPTGVPVVSAEGKGTTVVPSPTKPPTGPGSPSAAPASEPVRTPSRPRREPALRLVDPNAPARRKTAASGRANTRSKGGVKTPVDPAAAEAAARRVWQPGMSVTDLQMAAQISRAAASKHRRILEAEAGQGQQQLAQ